MPLPGLGLAKHFTPSLCGSDLGTNFLRDSSHGRFRNTQPTHFPDQLLGRFAKWIDGPTERNDLLGRGRFSPRIQANNLVPRSLPLAATLAVIVMATEFQGPDQAQDGPPAKPLQLGVGFTLGAGDTRSVVPPFFRSFRAAARNAAPTWWRRSRRANSVLPRSWLSGLVAINSPKRAASR
jgi:hypothetical protein